MLKSSISNAHQASFERRQAAASCPQSGHANKHSIAPDRAHRGPSAAEASSVAVTTSRAPAGPQTLEEALRLSAAFNKGFSTSLHTENAYWVDEVRRGIMGHMQYGLHACRGRAMLASCHALWVTTHAAGLHAHNVPNCISR